MTPALTPGALYGVRWHDHPNKWQMDPGYVGEFIEWRTDYCAMHGEKAARRALFHYIKPNGQRSYMFAVDPRHVTIKAVPCTLPANSSPPASTSTPCWPS